MTADGVWTPAWKAILYLQVWCANLYATSLINNRSPAVMLKSWVELYFKFLFLYQERNLASLHPTHHKNYCKIVMKIWVSITKAFKLTTTWDINSAPFLLGGGGASFFFPNILVVVKTRFVYKIILLTERRHLEIIVPNVKRNTRKES